MKKTKPSLTLVKRLDNGGAVICANEGTRRDGKIIGSFYLYTPIPSDWGKAFEVEKLGEDVFYHVCVDGEKSLCDCQGHERFGYCRHLNGAKLLLQRK